MGKPRKARIKAFRWVIVLALIIVFKPPYKKTDAAPINKQEAPKVVSIVKPTEQPQVKPVETSAPVAPAAKPVEAPKPAAPPRPTYTGGKNDWLAAAGIPQSEWAAVDYIVTRESGWRPLVTNSIGAHGLCQALPASKMASAGSDYKTNPVTQLRWCSSYAAQRYGGWWGAYRFWQANHWW